MRQFCLPTFGYFRHVNCSFNISRTGYWSLSCLAIWLTKSRPCFAAPSSVLAAASQSQWHYKLEGLCSPTTLSLQSYSGGPVFTVLWPPDLHRNASPSRWRSNLDSKSCYLSLCCTAAIVVPFSTTFGMHGLVSSLQVAPPSWKIHTGETDITAVKTTVYAAPAVAIRQSEKLQRCLCSGWFVVQWCGW